MGMQIPIGELACPACGKRVKSRVIDSRGARDDIRRRRECTSCKHRFTTYERVDEFMVIPDISVLNDDQKNRILRLAAAILKAASADEAAA